MTDRPDPKASAEAVARLEFYVEGLAMGLDADDADAYAGHMAESMYGQQRIAHHALRLVWADLRAALVPRWLRRPR